MTTVDMTMPAPLVVGEDGTIRVAGSRVTLDSILHAYRSGDTVEEILDSFPSLTPRDVYGAIAYYLQFPPPVDRYLDEQSSAAAESQTAIDLVLDSRRLRQRIRERHASRH